MKITMYELLGLVKDGKAPKKIKYDGQEYKITKILLEDNNYYFNYINEDMECIFPINTNCLNDEVEIIEEEKKIPEKLDIRQEKNIKNNWKWKIYGKEHSYNISTPQKIIADKLNEIVHYLQYLKSKGDE